MIRRLEEGRSQHDLPLHRLIRLADALAVPPAALFRHHDPSSPLPDDCVVEAALAASPTFQRSDELARGLGWPLSRTHHALRRLRQRLSAGGQDLRRTSNGWSLIPRLDLLSRQQQTQLERARISRRGLNTRTAAMLHRIHHGDLPPDFEQRLTNPDRVALATLLKSGLVVRSESRFRTSNQVARSLKPPTRAQRPKRG